MLKGGKTLEAMDSQGSWEKQPIMAFERQLETFKNPISFFTKNHN